MTSDDEVKKKGNTRMQWILTLLVNGASLSYGFEIGWMSPTARLLQSAQSPTGGVISDSDLAWIASIMNLSAILGAMIFRYITDKYGRKIGILWLAFPQLISWIMKVVYPTTTTLVISRLFGGVASGGLFLCVPIYVKEISQDDIRGSLAVLLPVVQYIGVIVMYALGAYLDYYYVVYSVIGVPVIVTLLLLRAPESPAFLVKQGKVDEAREIVAFLRGLHKNDSTVTNEVAAMAKADEVYKSLPEVSTEDIMFKDRKWRRWIYVISMLFILRAMNGALSIQTYALSVLLSTGGTYSVSPEILTFTFPIVMIVTALLLTAFVERFERKEVAEKWSTNSSPTTNTTRKKQKKSNDDDFLSLAMNYFKRPESDTDIIAKGWAMKLNRLSPLQRRFAEKIINDVIFEAEMNTLTRDGVIFVSSTPDTHFSSPVDSNIPSVESVDSQSLPRFSPCNSLSTTIISTSDSASKQPVILEPSSTSSSSYLSVPSSVNNPSSRGSRTLVVSTPINSPTKNVSHTAIPSRNNNVLGDSLTPVPSLTASPNQYDYVAYQSPPSQNQLYAMTQYVIQEPCLNTSFPINYPGPSSSNTSLVSIAFNQPTQKNSSRTENECTGAETALQLATYLQNFNSF